MSVGKRKAWLRDDEPFFGWQLLRANLIRAAQVALSRGGAAVRIYGELYGGRYPHPDVAPVPGASAVQTGIWYCPDIRFALFDVLRHEDPDDEGVFLRYADVAAIAAEAGLDVVPLLATGTRSALDDLPVRFATRVPPRHGLPELPNNLPLNDDEEAELQRLIRQAAAAPPADPPTPSTGSRAAARHRRA